MTRILTLALSAVFCVALAAPVFADHHQVGISTEEAAPAVDCKDEANKDNDACKKDAEAAPAPAVDCKDEANKDNDACKKEAPAAEKAAK